MNLTAYEKQTLAKAAQIMEKVVRYGDVLNAPTEVKQYLTLRYAGLDREEMHVLYLDTRHQLLETVVESTGTVDSASVYPREIAKTALRLGAAAVILSHNHPSGCPEPSEADRRITRKVQDGLALLDIRLLDHIVVGGIESVSMAERGWV